MVIYVDGTIIETREKPWLGGMEVNRFNAVGSIKYFTLCVVGLEKMSWRKGFTHSR